MGVLLVYATDEGSIPKLGIELVPESRSAHRVLLDGVRGAGKQPGELRRSQNWIGGTRPGNAAFVPPPADRVADLLGDSERFIHQEAGTLPPLVRIALKHAQFETIHPFLDGNGRIGRLLIAALLEHWRLPAKPLQPGQLPAVRVAAHDAALHHRAAAAKTGNHTFPTATAAIKVLEGLGVVTEMTGQKKNRSYSYQPYIELLSR
jgi:fido (protein-threonine AMPylation protein)